MERRLPEHQARVVIYDTQGTIRYLPPGDYADIKRAIRGGDAFWEGEDWFGGSLLLRLSNITDVVYYTQESSDLIQECEELRKQKDLLNPD